MQLSAEDYQKRVLDTTDRAMTLQFKHSCNIHLFLVPNVSLCSSPYTHFTEVRSLVHMSFPKISQQATDIQNST